jgi:putative transposase
MKEYWTGGHTKHRLKYHVVCVLKYRKRVLRGGVKKRLKELLYEACEVNRWWIHELNIRKDHVHMLIQINSRESIAEVMQKIKGGSSRIIREEYPELEEFLWGDSFWGDGYFAETVGVKNEEVIEKYIRDQSE